MQCQAFSHMYPLYGIRNLSVSKYMEKKYVGSFEMVRIVVSAQRKRPPDWKNPSRLRPRHRFIELDKSQGTERRVEACSNFSSTAESGGFPRSTFFPGRSLTFEGLGSLKLCRVAPMMQQPAPTNRSCATRLCDPRS